MNKIKISGIIDANTILSLRTSGVQDAIPINISPTYDGQIVFAQGELHTYNTPDKKLHMYVEPTTIEMGNYSPINEVELSGYLCRSPKYRTTPNGKRITELCLAVPRGLENDYIPCIAWGSVADNSKDLEIGNKINVIGRVQSRNYIKGNSENTTIEVSIQELKLDI